MAIKVPPLRVSKKDFMESPLRHVYGAASRCERCELYRTDCEKEYTCDKFINSIPQGIFSNIQTCSFFIDKTKPKVIAETKVEKTDSDKYDIDRRKKKVKVLIILGDSAVGKMTVGQKIRDKTGFSLFHNHMAIEPVLEVFGYFNQEAINKVREVFFEEFAKTNKPGFIFTYQMAFDERECWDYLEHIESVFAGAEIYYVELVASLNKKLERNSTPNRLMHKPSKRDKEASQMRIINDGSKHRFESFKGEFRKDNYIKIDTEHLTADETADKIIEWFSFKVIGQQ